MCERVDGVCVGASRVREWVVEVEACGGVGGCVTECVGSEWMEWARVRGVCRSEWGGWKRVWTSVMPV